MGASRVPIFLCAKNNNKDHCKYTVLNTLVAPNASAINNLLSI